MIVCPSPAFSAGSVRLQRRYGMIGRRRWLGGGAAVALGGWRAGATPARAADGFAALPAAFARIEAERGGRLGVAVLDTGSLRQVGHRQTERFPMASTFKAPLAGAVLARADSGQESMDRRIRFTREDLVVWSPATGKRVGGEGMTLAELCEATVTLSDNTAANLLLGALGGPAALTAFFRSLGDEVSRLDRTEPALNEARPDDPRDTTSPAAMLGSLRALTLGTALSPSSKAQLMAWLRANRTGDKRLRAGLPAGWQAGEKTGSGEHNSSNDVGLLWPPGGRPPMVVTAYLTQGPADGAVRDAALAEVAAAIATAMAA
jgi:beta-lactamase class A